MPDAAALTTWGLPGLFLAGLLAGSVLPAPSEAVLAALVLGGVPPLAAAAVATAGNVLGAVTLYLPARWAAGSPHAPLARWAARRSAEAPGRLARARARLGRYGAPALALSWLPVVGDALVLAAGAAGVRPLPFLLFTVLGKGLRYLAVALAAAGAT